LKARSLSITSKKAALVLIPLVIVCVTHTKIKIQARIHSTFTVVQSDPSHVFSYCGRYWKLHTNMYKKDFHSPLMYPPLLRKRSAAATYSS
jgi:hypothetical protein